MVVTGLSGSGKTHAIHALEDLGYFCVDNLPTQLIPTFAELCTRGEAGLERVAIVVDVRERGFLTQFPPVYRKLRSAARSRGQVDLPRGESLGAGAAVQRDAQAASTGTRSIRGGRHRRGAQEDARHSGMADVILDTSNLTVHELRDVFGSMTRDERARADMVVNLLSFGFKHGAPAEADLVFDVRCLPNPHFVDRLRHLTGRDAKVVRFMRKHKVTQDFIDRLTEFLKFALPHYVTEGKSYLTVAIGCTGGQHRSVMIAEALKRSLEGTPGVRLRVKHRDG